MNINVIRALPGQRAFLSMEELILSAEDAGWIPCQHENRFAFSNPLPACPRLTVHGIGAAEWEAASEPWLSLPLPLP